jgi:hypothetical protein
MFGRASARQLRTEKRHVRSVSSALSQISVLQARLNKAKELTKKNAQTAVRALPPVFTALLKLILGTSPFTA